MSPHEQDHSSSESPGTRRASRLIFWGVTLTTLGLVFTLSADSTLGGWITLVGLLISVTALHRFGRSGKNSSAAS